mmetsp:Transcript_29376/g.85627  ORF Transcript_29376/g.85627 Transcript_29376/m.85627 type:complete len:235 (+) Transcript_29376:94-798(+)
MAALVAESRSLMASSSSPADSMGTSVAASPSSSWSRALTWTINSATGETSGAAMSVSPPFRRLPRRDDGGDSNGAEASPPLPPPPPCSRAREASVSDVAAAIADAAAAGSSRDRPTSLSNSRTRADKKRIRCAEAPSSPLSVDSSRSREWNGEGFDRRSSSRWSERLALSARSCCTSSSRACQASLLASTAFPASSASARAVALRAAVWAAESCASRSVTLLASPAVSAGRTMP